jgi:hypothetical protein
MAILGRFTKQPTEVLDYDVDFSEWFADRSDTLDSFTVTAQAGITVASSSNTGNVVKVVLSGGTNGGRYKITVRVTTTPSAFVREADFIVSVKES